MSQYADFSNELSSLLLIFKKTTPERKVFAEHVSKVINAFKIIEQNVESGADEEERIAIYDCIFDFDSQELLEKEE